MICLQRRMVTWLVTAALADWDFIGVLAASLSRSVAVHGHGAGRTPEAGWRLAH